MNKEVRFAQILEEIKRTGREQGNMLSKEQIDEAFAELELDSSRMEMISDYLKSQHIGIGEQIDLDEALTDEDKDYLKIYLDELEELPTYSDGEKRAYTIQAMAGEKDACAKIIEIYLKNVVDIAKIYTGQGVLLEDLIGEGNVALTGGVTMLDSMEKPEECEGMLIKMVMDAMEELIKESTDNSEIEKKSLERVNEVSSKAEKLSKEYARKVTVEELIDEYKLSRKAIIDAIRISGFAIDYIEIPEELMGEEG